MTADAPNVPPVQGARQARYAEAIDNAVLSARLRAVVAVADAEQAELRAEVERLTEINRELVDTHNTYLKMVVRLEERAEAAEAKAEDFEGRYEVSHDSRMHAERALERAEAELRALREGIEALADEFRRLGNACGGESPRAVAFYEAAGKTERYLSAPEVPCTCPDDHFETDTDCAIHTKPHAWQRDWGVEPNAEADAQFKADNAAIRAAQAAVDLSAPVSSGEAETGEATDWQAVGQAIKDAGDESDRQRYAAWLANPQRYGTFPRVRERAFLAGFDAGRAASAPVVAPGAEDDS